MGGIGTKKINLLFAVAVVALLAWDSRHVNADMNRFGGSTSSVFPAWGGSRGSSIGEGARDLTLQGDTRRILAASSTYIGYTALTGNQVLCPPQSGRSYYTPNCKSATGPVQLYTRGCSTLTHCVKDPS